MFLVRVEYENMRTMLIRLNGQAVKTPSTMKYLYVCPGI